MSDLLGLGRPRSGDAARQIKRWVQETCMLPENASVMVTELRCNEEGCPPLETVIAVQGPDREPMFGHVHKGLSEVTRNDIVHLALEVVRRSDR